MERKFARWSAGVAVAFWMALGLVVCRDAQALDAAAVAGLASEEASDKAAAIEAIAAAGDPAAAALLTALRDGQLRVTPSRQFVIRERGKLTDAVTGQALDAEPDGLEKVTINNRLRSQVESAVASLRILARDPKDRLEAARGIEPGPGTLALLGRALAAESDPAVRAVLRQSEAAARLQGTDSKDRIAAIAVLAQSPDGKAKTLLQPLTEKSAAGAYAEPDAAVREAAIEAVSLIERRLLLYDYVGRLFTGASLGSILLLVALGLAITYGLLGVINMAHGEMLMIGAYATYATQQVFRSHFPASVDWYLPCALPVAFIAAGAVGMLLERTVIRWLYGRPLETLLATWGISLFLIQAVRQVFGAQNVEVANPSWMSGGIELTSLVLPYNRIVIIAFSAAVLLLVWLMLSKTRLGLFIRGVTQNRTMASCVGVPTGRVDLLAFGLGSGIGGLAGCALSQVGNVGPDLGQSYIIDSFMVVVLGGVGQLLGTVYAALGLGVASKLLETHIGAVPTKILILVLIIAFIQKRPQGLFALKGRSVEN
ncbi:MAG: urea ABC transporter permease subunit UrtB [Betaproteobacteria bacterium]